MPRWHLNEAIRFVHTADLHLDSPFKGLTSVPADFQEQLRSATFDTFNNIVELCVKQQVDFLLVAGDVFDAADRSLRAQLRFRDGLTRLSEAGIASFIVHGNHDPVDGWGASLSQAEDVNVFGPNLASYPYKEVRVYGFSYPTRAEKRNLAREFPLRPRTQVERPFHIGLLHCNVGSNPQHANYAPCELSDLHARDIDYWALGHVHERAILSESPHIVYPGNPQGREFREAGPRGCFVVEVSPDGQVVPTFYDLAAVQWEIAELSIAGVATLQALEAKLRETLERLRQTVQKPLVVRLMLTGQGSLYRELRRDRLLEDLLEHLRPAQLRKSPPIFVDRIDMRCFPEVDLGSLAERQDLIGTILRLADEYEADEDARVRQILGPVWNDPRYSRYLEDLEPAELRQILADARILCIENLGGLS